MSQELDTMAANGTITLRLSPQDRIPFTPEHYTAEGAAPEGPVPVYTLQPIANRQQPQIGLAIQAKLGAFVTREEVREAVRDAAVAILEPEEASRVCAELEELIAYEAMPERDEPQDQRLADLRVSVQGHERRLLRRHAPLREVLVIDRRQTIAFGEFTVRAAVVAWEGLAAPCIRRDGFVTEEAALAIPDDDWGPLQTRCFQLTEVTPQLDRGSASP